MAKATTAACAEVIVAAHSIDARKKTAFELNGRFLSLDLTSSKSIEAVAEAVGTVDLLANVAGINLRKRFEEYSPTGIAAIFPSNLFGPMHQNQRIGRNMMKAGTPPRRCGLLLGTVNNRLALP